VVRHDGIAVLVARPEGVSSLAFRSSTTPTAGDWVAVVDDVVTAVLPRTSFLRRRDPTTDDEQALAANVDVVGIVCGLDRPLTDGRLQRFVAITHDAGAEPVVVLTKADLVEDPGEQRDLVGRAVPGVAVLTTSARRGDDIEALRALAAGRTLVLLGESGAGKSTLLNALAGVDVAATGEVRAGDAKGRHTTTSRQLHQLPTGGVLIDSPGIREVGLFVDLDALAASFEDVEELAAGCRFRDCGHGNEPGCAVADAVASGALSRQRHDAWRAMRVEVLAAGARAEEQARRGGGRRRPR
jgi:ribosome biogenesis GTPase / thiamine phosphate phosphatase